MDVFLCCVAAEVGWPSCYCPAECKHNGKDGQRYLWQFAGTFTPKPYGKSLAACAGRA